jgi:MYXO-CTERM domain-containing protein
MRRVASVGSVFALLLALGVAAPARAADYYVAPSGNDQDPGTLDKPFATLERAQTAAAAGDTVYLRGGEYRFSGTQASIGVALTKSGQSGKPIHYFAYPGELPILDLFELKPQQRVTGIDVRASWIHIRGLEVRGVRQLIVGDSWGVRIRGDHNLVEQLNVHDCQAPGIFIASGAGNLILNCDSHHNYDPLEDGGNADGFGCHSNGGDNVLRGCRAYENSDDGFDFINAPGTCLVERSWSFRNGFIPNTNMAGANGAGFKSGGFGEPPNVPATGVPRHVIRFNVAFGNRAIGFYANHHPGGIDFFNNTAFDNPANYDMRTASGGTSAHKLRNNVAAAPGKDIVNFNGGSADFNSWTLPVSVSNADFISVDKALALMPRQADGSLPNVPFVQLVEGSDLIDKGEDVSLPFTGKAPDLGAYEWGQSSAVAPIDASTPDAASGVDAGGPMPKAAGAPSEPAANRPMQPAVTTPGVAGMLPAGSTATASMQPKAAGSAATTAAESGHEPGTGCGCSVTPRRTSASLWLVLLATLGLATRRTHLRSKATRWAIPRRSTAE